MDAGWIVLIVVLAWVSLMAVLLVGLRSVSERTMPTPAPPPTNDVLVNRLLEALDTNHRAEIDNLLMVVGAKADPEVAEVRRLELLRELAEGAGIVGPAPIPNPNPQAGLTPLRPVPGFEGSRGPWDFPVDPGDLEVSVDDVDPHTMQLPLDDLPDATVPAYPTDWQPEEPIAFPEPVPEMDRQRIVGMAVGENPLEDLGISPGWHEATGT